MACTEKCISSHHVVRDKVGYACLCIGYTAPVAISQFLCESSRVRRGNTVDETVFAGHCVDFCILRGFVTCLVVIISRLGVTCAIECMDIYAIYSLFQTGKFLPCIVVLVVVLSVFLWIVTTKCISAPIVILATSEGGVLDKETCYIHRIIYSSILVVALCLFLLALLDSLFCTFNGSVQLFERAAGVVVGGSLCGYVCTDGLSVFEQLLQLHSSIVGRHRGLESFDADTVGLNCSEPCIVSILINHLPLCAGSGFEQIQAGIGILTLPAEELLRLCGHVRDEVIAIL